MAPSLKQTLSQQLRLTPQQVLLSSLLQLPIQALEQRIKQEMEQNPLLEEVNELEETAELEDVQELETEPEQLLKQEAPETDEQEEKIQEATTEKAERETAEKESREVDWEQFLNDENRYEYRAPRDYSSEEEEQEFTPTERRTLADHLLEQLRWIRLNDLERRIAEYIIWNINEDGYLIFDTAAQSSQNDISRFSEEVMKSAAALPETPASPAESLAAAADASDERPNTRYPLQHDKPDEIIQLIADEFQTDRKTVEKILQTVQAFDPPGIAARDLRECILIQLRRREQSYYDEHRSLAIRIIQEDYPDFINRRYDKLAKHMKLSIEILKPAIQEILTINPKPGEGYIIPEQNFIIPDLIVKRLDDGFDVQLNDYNVPRLRINNAYRKMMLDKKNGGADAKEFVKNKLESAKWLINSLYRRRDTLRRTMEAIVELQQDFFAKGKDYLKPMKLEDVASKINMDISTVSRATSGKYVQTDYGVYELKHFFSTGISRSDGEDVSTRQIKTALKKLVDEEDKRKPWSDDDLARLLSQQGTPIARRTITKYREHMKIPAARFRREI